MKTIRLLLTGLTLVFFNTQIMAATSPQKQEDSSPRDTSLQQQIVASAIDPQVFVENAASAGLAEVEMAKMALKKSTQDDVRHFAQMMIESHTQMNKELRALANNEGLNIPDEPTLLKKTKTFVLSQRQGESFDEAYAKNQVEAHEQTYQLFRQAANSPSENVRKFAEAKLHSLEHHLNVARALVTTVAQTRATESSPKAAQ